MPFKVPEPDGKASRLHRDMTQFDPERNYQLVDDCNAELHLLKVPSSVVRDYKPSMEIPKGVTGAGSEPVDGWLANNTLN